MSVLENFKNISWSPYGGRQGSNVIFFFFKFATKSLEKKKGGLSPPQRATGPCRPPLRRPTRRPSQQAPGGPVAHPAGDRGGLSPPQWATGSGHPYIRPPPSFPPHLTSKNPKKSRKKRGEKKGSGEALPNSALMIYR